MKKSDRARFFGKNLVWPKLGKKGPKMDVFNFFSKLSKVLSGNTLKRSVLFYLISGENRMSRKNLVLEILWKSSRPIRSLDFSNCYIF